jgi:ATP-binding cassette subfamily C protein CydCD
MNAPRLAAPGRARAGLRTLDMLGAGPAGRHLLTRLGALAFVHAGAILAQATALAHAITAVFLHRAGLVELRWDLALLAGALVVRAVAAWTQETLATRASAVAKSRLRMSLLRQATAADAGAGSGDGRAPTPMGEVAHLATQGLDSLDGYVVRYLPHVVLACVVPPLVLVRIALADWPSALVIAVTLPAIPVFMALVGWRTEARVRRQWAAIARLAHHFLDVVEGLATLRVFGRAKAQEHAIATVSDDHRRAALGVLRVSFLSALVVELAATLSVALVAVQIGVRLVGGGLGLQSALLVLLLAPEVFLPLRQAGADYHAAVEGTDAAERIDALLTAVPVPDAGGTRPAPPACAHGVVMRDLAVWHNGAPAPALSSASLDLRPGEILAVVGRSGSGKSTLVSVLLRFTRPTSGTVRIAGVDLADIDPTDWRRQVAWVPQRPALLAGTVADNVRLGTPGADTDAVRRALALASGDDIDPWFVLGEDGTGLSAGECQRVAVARAFLRAEHGAGLLVLDEPTAHLDGATEAKVVAGLRTLAHGRCVLMVVHRPALAAAADSVVRLGEATP